MDAPQPPVLSAADALALRYGAEASPQGGPWNEHIALLLSHRSIRGYRPDALPDSTLETLVAAAQSAATSSNLQTWSVIAVTDPDKKAALAKVASRSAIAVTGPKPMASRFFCRTCRNRCITSPIIAMPGPPGTDSIR